MNKVKVHLSGRDFVNWATDDDYFFTKSCLENMVEIVESASKADVIHTINWKTLLEIPRKDLTAKTVFAHVPHDVTAMLEEIDYLKIVTYVDLWVAPSKRAYELLTKLKLKTIYVPYGVNLKFYQQNQDQIKLELEKLGIDPNKYIISSFQRDTEGADLKSPKLVKGPDVFLEVVKNVYSRRKNILILLAGPRRFWLKKKLSEHGIPYYFVGKARDGDDLLENTLDSVTINRLYNISDLYLVGSRNEGGPKAILEAPLAGCKIISSTVGHAKDILEQEQLYTDFVNAADKICMDIDNNNLARCIELNKSKILKHHTKNEITKTWLSIYSNKSLIVKSNAQWSMIGRYSYIKFFLNKFRNNNEKLLTILFDFKEGAWGGGNQFLKHLRFGLARIGWTITDLQSKIGYRVLINSFLYNEFYDKFFLLNTRFVLHRIDGPTDLIRGEKSDIDSKMYEVNRKYADITVYQSEWSLFKNLEMGFVPVRPVLIRNTTNGNVFYRGNKSFDKSNKIKLISSSWSGNPRKGGAVYKWLDENLDFTKYEYVFIGRLSEKVKNIIVVDPLPPEELSAALRESDIYITASENDPCSNALIEAIACGLPSIAANSGGHPEIIKFCGCLFDKPAEIPDLLERIIANYESYQNLCVVPSFEAVAHNYERALLSDRWQ